MNPVPQAGGIVVREDRDGLSVLLVRAKSDPTIWIFPKGHIEPGESEKETALRETQEEAGVDGDVIGKVGEPVEFHNGRALVRVQYYAIRARDEWPHTDGRAKQWFSPDAAIEAVNYPEDRELLREALAMFTQRATKRGGRRQ
jgi:diadenosine hexaphosphate hydrolase (ATP-forming)